jgi:hypothetical protein
MKSFCCVVVLLMAAGLCVTAAPANAGCTKILGTADGWDKNDAVTGAQAALAGAINDMKGKKAISVKASKPKPQPYWRDSGSAELFFKPDVVTAKSYTVCWRGVVSPVVCTSGAAVCF